MTGERCKLNGDGVKSWNCMDIILKVSAVEIEFWQEVIKRGKCIDGEMTGVEGTFKCSSAIGLFGDMSIGDVGETGSTGDIISFAVDCCSQMSVCCW